MTDVVLSRMSTVSGSVEPLTQTGSRVVMVMGACAALAAAGVASVLRAPDHAGSGSRRVHSGLPGVTAMAGRDLLAAQ